jgi:hypothetical protein
MTSLNFGFSTATAELLEKLNGGNIQQQIISTSQNLFDNWVFYITVMSVICIYLYTNTHRILDATNLLDCDNYDEDTCPSNVCEWKDSECIPAQP